MINELFRNILRSKTRDGDNGESRLPEIDLVLSKVSVDTRLSDRVSDCIIEPRKSSDNQIEALDMDIFEMTTSQQIARPPSPPSPPSPSF